MSSFIQGLLNTIWNTPISYTTIRFFLIVAVAVVLYYLFPKKARYLVLLATSCLFYYVVVPSSWQIVVFGLSVAACYGFGLLIERVRKKDPEKRKGRLILLWAGILISGSPFLASKIGDFITSSVIHTSAVAWIVPIGASFYTLQIISYLADIYHGKLEAQKNPLKFGLYISFFPAIIQGPISRYQQLGIQLTEGHSYKPENIIRGVQMVLWGLFLKLMIADKAAIPINILFTNYEQFSGFYIILAGVLYPIHLYADFMSCVTISRGVSELFGIQLMDNFHQPLFANRVKDFWRRWHISLSEWLKDYIFIPLGGSRKGKFSKFKNLLITFMVSGLWHGGTWKYLFWGSIYAFYQFFGDLINKPREKLLTKIHIVKGTRLHLVLSIITTTLLNAPPMIIFRSDTLHQGLTMVKNMFTNFNPWIFFDDSLFNNLGLSIKEVVILLISLLVLLFVGILHERGFRIRDWFNKQSLVVRWAVYLMVIWTIWIFGTYGFGFSTQDFIYGGF